jgi:hypothetical protein
MVPKQKGSMTVPRKGMHGIADPISMDMVWRALVHAH